MSDTFTAYVACPRCESFECHLMRNPKPKPSAEVMAHWERTHSTVNVTRWGGDIVRSYPDPPPPVDESGFEVVRQCKCGFEWGQK